jgi:hypothetical protein
MLQMKIKSDTDKNVFIRLIDVSGKTVYRQNYRLSNGINTLQLNNLNRLMKGMYMLKVGDGGNSKTMKVVKR